MRIIPLLFTVLILPSLSPLAAAEIRQMFFLIHPLIYSDYPSDNEARFGYDRRPYAEFEQRVAPRWRQAISEIGPGGLLIVWPVPSLKDTEPTRDLLDHAGDVLGNCCIEIPRSPRWATGAPLGDAILAHVGGQLIGALRTRGERWPVDEMTHAITSRVHARDIQAALAERGHTFHPETVTVEAWGESFEGCAGKWSAFIARDLGIKRPVRLRFDRTVPDARFLLDARYIESIPLGSGVELHLWQGADGHPVALYYAGTQAVADPLLYAEIHSAELARQIEVRDKYGERVWPPGENVLARPSADGIRVAVSRNLGRRPGWDLCPGEPAYVVGTGLSLASFRQALGAATIIEEK